MQELFDPNERPLSKEEITVVIQDATERLNVWKKRAVSSTVAFLLSCASVALLWRYSFDKYLILLSMALLLPFVVCGAIATQTWFDVRTMKKDGCIPQRPGWDDRD